MKRYFAAAEQSQNFLARTELRVQLTSELAAGWVPNACLQSHEEAVVAAGCCAARKERWSRHQRSDCLPATPLCGKATKNTYVFLTAIVDRLHVDCCECPTAQRRPAPTTGRSYPLYSVYSQTVNPNDSQNCWLTFVNIKRFLAGLQQELRPPKLFLAKGAQVVSWQASSTRSI